MKRFLLAGCLAGAVACGGGNNGANNGSNNGSNNGGSNNGADAGQDDVGAADMGPELPARSGASGEVDGVSIDFEGVAIASAGTDGSFTIFIADRDMTCDNLAFAPGESYLKFTVTPDDLEFAEGFYNELVSSVNAEVATSPEGCMGMREVIGENENLQPFTVILEEITDETLRGEFDMTLYKGLTNGQVSGTFEAVRCGMSLLPVCEL